MDGDFVVYWMQMSRRLSDSHALDYAIKCSKELKKDLVVYEGLRLDYPWANARHHTFIIEGMTDNAARAATLGVSYWPFIESKTQPARGVLKKICERAALVVTDDYPCFIVPEQTDALASRVACPVYAVDGNSVVPLAMLGQAVAAAAHMRPRIQKAFPLAWPHRSSKRPLFATNTLRNSPFEALPKDIPAFVASLPIDQSVHAVSSVKGGAEAAHALLSEFVKTRLPHYAESRSEPNPPKQGYASGLSPYLHYGHIGIDAVVEAVLDVANDFSIEALAKRRTGKRDGYYSNDVNISGFLDEAITWRDVGYHWHTHRRTDTRSLQSALPPWAMKSLDAHKPDVRAYLYSKEELDRGRTHDKLWNAAQRELVHTGIIHNYLRMLWGKKVLEWSKTPEEAYAILEDLNNKYALDGRDPNSYTGILWCFGLFDRPWPPERKVYGNIRYMSSDNTAKKFDVDAYLAYTDSLPLL
jgi:deoxyribodipyrimidine photo-lyase